MALENLHLVGDLDKDRPRLTGDGDAVGLEDRRHHLGMAADQKAALGDVGHQGLLVPLVKLVMPAAAAVDSA